MCASAWNVLLPTLKISQWTNYEYKGSLSHAAIRKPFPVSSTSSWRKELLTCFVSLFDFDTVDESRGLSRCEADHDWATAIGVAGNSLTNRLVIRLRLRSRLKFVSTRAFGSSECCEDES